MSVIHLFPYRNRIQRPLSCNRVAIHGNTPACSCIAGIHAIHGNKKPGSMAGFSSKNETCDSYLAELRGIGRRAREVIPAAMRALVRTLAMAKGLFIRRLTLSAFLSQRNKKIRRA
ncbi:MAG TPA: hypothetical protein VFN25_14830 [Dokdonella sp.]|uniref:hypothetical protein n=1 Tax=Dokdonella sp. TaxID=2291710 RepID=UPI002D7FD5A5|nr:hypothetical protein [Dokdonella sp.]HET9034166.1 hypothetical protein [Dokdonella sp.]